MINDLNLNTVIFSYKKNLSFRCNIETMYVDGTFDVTFVYKILNGEIDCPDELLYTNDLKVPSFNSRRNPPFGTP